MPPVSDQRILHCEWAGDLCLYMKDVSIYTSRELTDFQRSSKNKRPLVNNLFIFVRFRQPSLFHQNV